MTKKIEKIGKKVNTIIMKVFECSICGAEFDVIGEAEDCYDSHNASYFCTLCKSKTVINCLSSHKNDDGEIIEISSEKYGRNEAYFCYSCLDKIQKNKLCKNYLKNEH